ncbi:MAG: hypothetical protein H0X71_06695 [Rubrobacter sp.]|nr:hypothetical protein [Rubrobacter sp.]
MSKRLTFLAAMLAMAPVAAATVLAQSEESVANPTSPSVQYQSESAVCPHVPGEFLVGYVSEEAFQGAPQENVIDTFDSILVQHLAYPEIKDIPDQSSRFAAEETRRQELLFRSGVSYVEYNCITSIAGV